MTFLLLTVLLSTITQCLGLFVWDASLVEGIILFYATLAGLLSVNNYWKREEQ